MFVTAKTNQYWIAPNAINITLNALSDPDRANRIQASVAAGSVISCYMDGIEGLGLDNGRNPRRWPLSLSPTYFNSYSAKYVYVAVPRSEEVGSQAVVVFPSEKLDIYGRNEAEAQVGSVSYYYIWLQGIISDSGAYGDVPRQWTAEMDFGSLGTYEDIMDMSETEWYSFDAQTGIVQFLKPIFMKVGSYFQNLILGNRELTGVATAATSEDYVDSETLVATPSYIHAHYLRRDAEDTAAEQIGFLKGLWIGVRGLYEITAEGVGKFKSLFADDITAQRMQTDDVQSSNYTGEGIADTGWRLTKDYNGHSKLTIDELYVRMKAVFESLEIKRELVSGGNQVQSCAASVISKVDYLNGDREVLGYEVYKIPFTLRNAVMMLAKGQNPFGSYSRTRTTRLQLTAAERQSVRYVRCYFLAKEGDRKIQNWWRVADPNDNTSGNDLARCQTFNLASDSISERDTYWGPSATKQGNVFWWRKLAGVSTSPVEIDGKMYHYFDVYCNPTAEAATPYTYAGAMQGSDIPAPGDEVSQWGNDNNRDRMNLIVHEVNGQDAAVKMYEGINQFSMENGLYGNPLKIRFAPKTGCKVHTTKWEVVTERFVAPIPVECGTWSQGTTARYYEIWQYGGSSWLCVASNGGTFKVIESFSTYAVGDTVTQTVYDTLTVGQQMCCARESFGTTTDTPSASSPAWRQYAAKGEKGDNAIRMDLDNEYDSIQYQGDGVTKVSPSGTVQTTAYLFDGVTDKSADATFIISNRSGMSDQQATISGRVVTVSGLTSDGEVTVRAEYPASSGKYYYAKFTVKKLIGIDKYDLVVTPNAVPVNTSNTVADTTINVQVYRTPANGGTRHLVEFTNKTANNYGLTLSVKDSLNNNLTETTGTGTVTTRTFNLTGTMATNADNVMVVLTKDSKTQDAETIPITHVHNGIDGSGSNAVRIDLDNEMDSIPCDSDGKVLSQTVLEANARIYDGASPVSSGVSVSSIGAIAGVSAVPSVSGGVVNIKWTIPATGSGTPLSVNKYTAPIVLTWGGNSYYATFTANVVKSGEPGVNPTIFQLLPSPSQISFKRDSSGTIPSSTQTLSLSIKKSDENGTSVIAVAASGLTVRYRTDQAPSSASDGTAWPSAGLSVSSSATYGNVYIAAFGSNGTLVDRETVAITKDGENGAKGDNGENAIRIDIDNEYDSIQYQGDGVTKVSPSGTVQTTAYLFDGVTDKSADATFTISNRSGMSDQQATISGRVVTVSGLTSDGEVTVRAEYPVGSGKYYYAKFTVKKLVGIDKYDLVVTPNAVPVNTSNTVADTTINVQVYRTPANGGTRHLVEFTNKTANNYGLTLSVKDSLNNNLTETTGTGTVTTRTFNLTGTMATNADNVMVVLTKDSKTQDAETIPITHVHNGIDGSGSNAVRIDLDNEMDSIPCDSDGKVLSQTVLEVNARIYDGAAPVTSGVAVSSVGAIAGVSAVPSVSSGVVNIKWTIPATGSGTPLSVNKYTSQIVLTWGGNSYYATFTANVVKSGEPGVSPTIMQLMPGPTQISFKRDSSGTIPSSTQTISLSVKVSFGQNPPTIVTVAASGLTVRYRTDQMPSSASDGTAWPSAGLPVSSSVTYGNVYIAAFDGSSLVDAATVAIMKDGENGQNAIHADLDNEHEDFLADDAGNIKSAPVTSQARLYNGTALVSSGVTWSIDSSSGVVTNDSSSPYYAGINSGTGLLTVKGINAGSAWVKVKAMYGGHSYYAKFTSNRKAQDKYSLVIEPNAITYNSSVAWSNKNISISAIRLSIDGSKSEISTFNTGGIYLAVWFNDGATTTWYTATSVFQVVEAFAQLNDNFLFELRRVKSGQTYDVNNPATYTVEDNETIPVNKVANGADGAPGQAAVNVIVSPASLIVNQDLNNPLNLSTLTEKVYFKVLKGNTEITPASVSVMTGTYAPVHCTVSGSNADYATLTSITASNGVYYDTAEFFVSLTYADGATTRTIERIKVRVYANLLGTWKASIEGDVQREIASSTTYTVDGETFTVKDNLGNFVKSSTRNVSELQQTTYIDILQLTYPATSGDIDGKQKQVTAGTYRVIGDFNLSDLPTGTGLLTISGPGVNKTWTLTGGGAASVDDVVTFTAAGQMTIAAGDDLGSSNVYDVLELVIYQPQDRISKVEQTAEGINLSVRQDLASVGIAISGTEKSIRLSADKTIIDSDVSVGSLSTMGEGSSVRISGGIAEFFGLNGVLNIQLGLDDNGCAVLKFYDKDGKFMYDLGPQGIVEARTQKASAFSATEAIIHAVDNSNPPNELFMMKYQRGYVLSLAQLSAGSVWYRFSEGYDEYAGQKTYRVSGSSTPSAYNEKAYNSNAKSSEQDNWHPTGTQIAQGYYVGDAQSMGGTMYCRQVYIVANTGSLPSLMGYIYYHYNPAPPQTARLCDRSGQDYPENANRHIYDYMDWRGPEA